MNNFDDIQQLWQQAAPQQVPDAAETIALFKKQRAKVLLKNIAQAACLLLTLVFIGLLPFYANLRLPVTRVGLDMVFVAVAFALATNANLLALLLRSSANTTDNSTYLASLKKYQQKLRFTHTRGISIYFLLLGCGMILYMYEFVRGNTWFAITAYVISSGWFAFAWFYLRPRTIRKQTAAINTLIEKLESITAQLLP